MTDKMLIEFCMVVKVTSGKVNVQARMVYIVCIVSIYLDDLQVKGLA